MTNMYRLLLGKVAGKKSKSNRQGMVYSIKQVHGCRVGTVDVKVIAGEMSGKTMRFINSAPSIAYFNVAKDDERSSSNLLVG